MPIWLFAILSIICVAGGLTVILHRNPVKSALALVVVMFVLAILYLGLAASFLAVIQIMVYAGAVMVLFLFVLFLLNVGVESPFALRPGRRITAGLVGLLVGVLLAATAVLGPGGAWTGEAASAPGYGGIEQVGELLFTRFLLSFELLSVLLLAALVGAVISSRPRWPVRPGPESRFSGTGTEEAS